MEDTTIGTTPTTAPGGAPAAGACPACNGPLENGGCPVCSGGTSVGGDATEAEVGGASAAAPSPEAGATEKAGDGYL